MYSIQFSDWGLVFEFTGPVTQGIIQDWLGDVQQLTGGFSEPFSVVIDLKEATPAEAKVQGPLREGLRVLQEAGLERTAIVVDPDYREVWNRLPSTSDEHGVRYVVAHRGSAWASKAHGWVQRGDEPADNSPPRAVRDGGG